MTQRESGHYYIREPGESAPSWICYWDGDEWAADGIFGPSDNAELRRVPGAGEVDALADVLESIVKSGAWYPTAIELDYAIGEGPAGDDLRMVAVAALEAVGREVEGRQ